MRQVEVLDLGLQDYKAVYLRQLSLVENRKAGKVGDALVLVEHPDVYTFGRKNKDSVPPLVRSIAFEVERGGEGTYHNPGQLVAYPILKLQTGEQDLHLHLRRLEETVIQTLKEFSISGERRSGATGVWIEGAPRKIASVGVAVRSWITYHGVALNVCNDLSGFKKINPCGFDASVMTSMEKELKDKKLSMLDVKAVFVEKFRRCFDFVATYSLRESGDRIYTRPGYQN